MAQGRGAEQALPTPPDGGWGWVVVFGSFMIHVIADGVAYSFGIFYIELLDVFKESRGVTGWVGSLMVGITWGSGPLASALTNRFGCQAVTIAGSLLSAIGFIISIWAPNIWFLYFSFGIVGGIGLGLIYLPAIVSVTYYFEKRRSFATGLAVCGSGVGTFVFAPLTKYLIEEYTWKGAILILAGILLNCILCGALFRPLEAMKSHNTTTDIPATCAPEPSAKLLNGTHSNGIVRKPNRNSECETDATRAVSKENGVLPVFPLLSVSATHTKVGSGFHSMQAIDYASNGVDDLPLRSYASDHLIHRVKQTPDKTPHQLDQAKNLSPMNRKDIFYERSLQNIPMYRSNPGLYAQSIMSIPRELNDGESSKPCAACCDEMRGMMDLSLLKNPLFVMFGISNFLTSIGFCIPYMFLPDRAILQGIDAHRAAFLISVIGIANTVGRVGFGFLSDRPFVNRLYLYNFALTICGAATCLSAFCYNFELLCVYAAVFGMFLGVYVSLTSVVLVDLLGLECLTSSFGLTLLFQGIAGIIGPPIAGSLYDSTSSYNVPFYIMGALIAVSGMMLFFIPCVQRYQEHHEKITQHDLDMGRRVQDETYVSSTLQSNQV